MYVSVSLIQAPKRTTMATTVGGPSPTRASSEPALEPAVHNHPPLMPPQVIKRMITPRDPAPADVGLLCTAAAARSPHGGVPSGSGPGGGQGGRSATLAGRHSSAAARPTLASASPPSSGAAARRVLRRAIGRSRAACNGTSMAGGGTMHGGGIPPQRLLAQPQHLGGTLAGVVQQPVSGQGTSRVQADTDAPAVPGAVRGAAAAAAAAEAPPSKPKPAGATAVAAKAVCWAAAAAPHRPLHAWSAAG